MEKSVGNRGIIASLAYTRVRTCTCNYLGFFQLCKCARALWKKSDGKCEKKCALRFACHKVQHHENSPSYTYTRAVSLNERTKKYSSSRTASSSSPSSMIARLSLPKVYCRNNWRVKDVFLKGPDKRARVQVCV